MGPSKLGRGNSREHSKGCISGSCWVQGYENPELEYGVNPAWKQVDRIISERVMEAGGREVCWLHVIPIAPTYGARPDTQAEMCCRQQGRPTKMLHSRE